MSSIRRIKSDFTTCRHLSMFQLLIVTVTKQRCMRWCIHLPLTQSESSNVSSHWTTTSLTPLQIGKPSQLRIKLESTSVKTRNIVVNYVCMVIIVRCILTYFYLSWFVNWFWKWHQTIKFICLVPSGYDVIMAYLHKYKCYLIIEWVSWKLEWTL